MPKQNYRQAKRNREETRKKRQLEKQQKNAGFNHGRMLLGGKSRAFGQ